MTVGVALYREPGLVITNPVICNSVAATTAACVGDPPERVTVGSVKYPVPGSVIRIEVTCPYVELSGLLSTTATAAAPPVPLIVTVGALRYPAPALVTPTVFTPATT